jgi:hypothetical protein
MLLVLFLILRMGSADFAIAHNECAPKHRRSAEVLPASCVCGQKCVGMGIAAALSHSQQHAHFDEFRTTWNILSKNKMRTP